MENFINQAKKIFEGKNVKIHAWRIEEQYPIDSFALIVD